MQEPSVVQRSKTGLRIKMQLQAERDKRGNKCQNEEGNCQEYIDLEFAHIKPTPILAKERDYQHRGRGRADRLVDIRKYPNCYRLWCHDCHRIYDQEGYRWLKDVIA